MEWTGEGTPLLFKTFVTHYVRDVHYDTSESPF